MPAFSPTNNPLPDMLQELLNQQEDMSQAALQQSVYGQTVNVGVTLEGNFIPVDRSQEWQTVSTNSGMEFRTYYDGVMGTIAPDRATSIAEQKKLMAESDKAKAKEEIPLFAGFLSTGTPCSGLQLFAYGKNLHCYGPNIRHEPDICKITPKTIEINTKRCKHLMPVLTDFAKREKLKIIERDGIADGKGQAQEVLYWQWKNPPQVDDTALISQASILQDELEAVDLYAPSRGRYIFEEMPF